MRRETAKGKKKVTGKNVARRKGRKGERAATRKNTATCKDASRRSDKFCGLAREERGNVDEWQ